MNEKHILSILECPDGYEIADDVFSRYVKVDRIALFEPALPKNSVDNPKAAFIATKMCTVIFP